MPFKDLCQSILVMLRAWLLRQTEIAEAATSVMGQSFEVHHGHVQALQLQKQIRLAGACPSSKHHEGPRTLKALQHPLPVALVSAFQ